MQLAALLVLKRDFIIYNKVYNKSTLIAICKHTFDNILTNKEKSQTFSNFLPGSLRGPRGLVAAPLDCKKCILLHCGQNCWNFKRKFFKEKRRIVNSFLTNSYFFTQCKRELNKYLHHVHYVCICIEMGLKTVTICKHYFAFKFLSPQAI